MKPISAILAASLLVGCNTVDRLQQVGSTPQLTPILDPVRASDYQPVTMPMPATPAPGPVAPNSLWRTGARGFFKDQRARQLGDVLTVNVVIQDQATLNNESKRGRVNTQDMGIGGLFGLDGVMAAGLNDVFDPSSSVGLSSEMDNKGQGSVKRKETVDLDVAAVIIQTLPNGNLVIHGRQEVRVNYEVRELVVAGIVRPEDITPSNTISHEKIAELRVAYGGRGQITDVQQPRYGDQVLDILLPF
ncbi:MAG: flagellar basal body L-ring protein FlgH [Pseudomonadota bacterium]